MEPTSDHGGDGNKRANRTYCRRSKRTAMLDASLVGKNTSHNHRALSIVALTNYEKKDEDACVVTCLAFFEGVP